MKRVHSYHVKYFLHTGSTPNADFEGAWKRLYIQDFRTRANAETALANVAKHPQFRGGTIEGGSDMKDES